MPRLDDHDLGTLAQLARLDLADVDRGALRADLERILTYVDRLAEVDDPGVDPLRHPALGGAEAFGGAEALGRAEAAVDPAELRPDAPVPGLSPDVLAALAPAWRDGRVEVPRTVDQDG